MQTKVTKFRAAQQTGIILVAGKKYIVEDGIFLAENPAEVNELLSAEGYGKAYQLVEETELQKVKQEQAYKEEAKQLEKLGIIEGKMIPDIIKLPSEAKKTIRQNISDIIAQWKPEDNPDLDPSSDFPKVEYPEDIPPHPGTLEKNYGMMTVGELREMCDIAGIEYPVTANKSKLIKLLEKKQT
jgi:hypothetical protein